MILFDLRVHGTSPQFLAGNPKGRIWFQAHPAFRAIAWAVRFDSRAHRAIEFRHYLRDFFAMRSFVALVVATMFGCFRRLVFHFPGRIVDSIGYYQNSSWNVLHSCGRFLRDFVDLRLDRVEASPRWSTEVSEFRRRHTGFAFELRGKMGGTAVFKLFGDFGNAALVVDEQFLCFLHTLKRRETLDRYSFDG